MQNAELNIRRHQNIRKHQGEMTNPAMLPQLSGTPGSDEEAEEGLWRTHGAGEAADGLHALAEVDEAGILSIDDAAGLRKGVHGRHQLPIAGQLLRISLRAAAPKVQPRHSLRQRIHQRRKEHQLCSGLPQQRQIPAPINACSQASTFCSSKIGCIGKD